MGQSVRGDSDRILRSLRENEREDPHLGVDSIFGALDRFWDTIHLLEEDEDQGWMEEYVGAVPRSETPELAPITPEMVSARIACIKKHTARGPDGWGANELADLPMPAKTELAMLFAACETFGTFPSAWNVVYTTLLQKKEDPLPSEIRPVGVASIVYRLWSALRFRSLQKWAEALYHPGLTAYREGIDTQALNLRRSLAIEEEILGGQETHILSFDLCKAFDYVPQRYTLEVCRRCGMPSQIVALLAHRMTHLVTHWKVRGMIGRARRMVRGLVQGCALSCLMYNLSVNPLLWRISTMQHTAMLEAHADDMYVQSGDMHEVRTTYGCMMHFLSHIKMPLQSSKTQYLRVASVTNDSVILGDRALTPVDHIKVLGQALSCSLPKMGLVSSWSELETSFSVWLELSSYV